MKDILQTLADLNNAKLVTNYPILIRNLASKLTSRELANLLLQLWDIVILDAQERYKDTAFFKITPQFFLHALFTALISPFSHLKFDISLSEMQKLILDPMFTSFCKGIDEGQYEKDEDFIKVMLEFFEADPILTATLLGQDQEELKNFTADPLSEETLRTISTCYASWEGILALQDTVKKITQEPPTQAHLPLIKQAKNSLEEVEKLILSTRQLEPIHQITGFERLNSETVIKKLLPNFSLQELGIVCSAFMDPRSGIDQKITSDEFAHVLFNALVNPFNRVIPGDKSEATRIILEPFYPENRDEEQFLCHVETKIQIDTKLRGALRNFKPSLNLLEWPDFSAAGNEDLLTNFVQVYQTAHENMRLLKERAVDLYSIFREVAETFPVGSDRRNAYLNVVENIPKALDCQAIDQSHQRISDLIAPHLNEIVAGETMLDRLKHAILSPSYRDKFVKALIREGAKENVMTKPSVNPTDETGWLGKLRHALSIAPQKSNPTLEVPKSLTLLSRRSPARARSHNPGNTEQRVSPMVRAR